MVRREALRAARGGPSRGTAPRQDRKRVGREEQEGGGQCDVSGESSTEVQVDYVVKKARGYGVGGVGGDEMGFLPTAESNTALIRYVSEILGGQWESEASVCV